METNSSSASADAGFGTLVILTVGKLRLVVVVSSKTEFIVEIVPNALLSSPLIILFKTLL